MFFLKTWSFVILLFVISKVLGRPPAINSRTLLKADPVAVYRNTGRATLVEKMMREERQPLEFQTPSASGLFGSSNSSLLAANATSNSALHTDLGIDCFPTGATFLLVTEEDCNIVINDIILRLPNPFEEKTWGYTAAADVDLSDETNGEWNYNTCKVIVRNLDRKQQDVFRIVDVALMAQSIIRKCVKGTKHPLGGHADIGRLDEDPFYMLVMGQEASNPSGPAGQTSTSILSGDPGKPVNAAAARETNIGLDTTDSGRVFPTDAPGIIQAPPTKYPIYCLNPSPTQRIKPYAASNCEHIIDEVILKLRNPLEPIMFGYNDSADFNLARNEAWVHGLCKISVNNLNGGQDRFPFVDVANTARRITKTCIHQTKHLVGGEAEIGSSEGNFYVHVGYLNPFGSITSGILLPQSSNNPSHEA